MCVKQNKLLLAWSQLCQLIVTGFPLLFFHLHVHQTPFFILATKSQRSVRKSILFCELTPVTCEDLALSKSIAPTRRALLETLTLLGWCRKSQFNCGTVLSN
jgi:hypothetical protein